MPIRTPHGRSAAYRTLWQWPLHSPVRLAVLVVVIVAFAAGASFVISAFAGGTPGRSAPASAAPTATRSPFAAASSVQPNAPAQPTALPRVPELSPSTLAPDTAPAAALQVATSWAAAWVNHPAGTTGPQWLDRLRPYTTAEYMVVLQAVDPANVPANRVTGAGRATRHSPKSVQVEVPTDAVRLLILVVQDQTGWKVAGYDRATA